MIRRPVRPSLKPLVRRTPLRAIGPRGMKRRAAYAKYLRSGTWREIRAAKIASCSRHVEAGGHAGDFVTCGKCRRGLLVGVDEIHVHHKSYRRLGAEKLADLAIRCRSCHQGEHWYRALR